MPLDKQLVPISLGFKGLETKTDKSKLLLGQMIVLENAIFSTPGLIRKRFGYDALLTNILGSSSSITAGSSCTTFRNELDLFTGTEVYSYSPNTQQWSDKGEATSLNLTVNPIIRNSYQQTTPDEAFHPAGIKVFTWTDSRGGCRYSVVDATSGEYLVSDVLLNIDAANAKPMAVGAYVVILYNNTTTFNLEYIAFPALNPATLVTGGPFVASSLLNHSNPNYDATTLNNTIFIAFNNTTSGTSVVRIGPTLVLSSHTNTSGAATTCINIAADPVLSQIWVSYSDGTNVNTYVQSYSVTPTTSVIVSHASPGVATVPTGTGFYAGQSFVFGGTGTAAGGTTLGTVYYIKTVLSSTTFTFSATSGGAAINTTGASVAPLTFNPQVAVLGVTLVEAQDAVNVCASVQNGLATFYYEIAGASTWLQTIRTNTVTNGGTVGTAALFLSSVGLASKPFIYNSIIYVTVAFQSNLQPTYFIVNQNGNVVGKMSPGNGGGLTTSPILPEIVTLNPGIFSKGSLLKDLLTTVSAANSTAIYTQTGVVEGIFDFVSEKTFITAELATNLHISGALLSVYDGTSVVEHGFSLYPENITLSDNAGAGGSVAAGTYGYQFCYEWTDNQGNIQRSAPSIEMSYTVADGGSTVTAVVPCLSLTAKTGNRTNLRIVGYRTQANGTVLTQFTSITSPTLNVPTSLTVSITDANADSSILGNPPIYTTGGVVENIAAPAIDVLTTYRDRVIGIPSESRQSFWYSQQWVPGTPIQFSDLFVQNIDARGGDLVTVAPLDDKLILFKETEIFYMTGDGPDPTGNNNDFTECWLITADGGSVSPVVVVTPMGLMYKSQKGIYLLDHSLNVSYIGASVAAYNSANLVSATLIDNTNQVRFCLDTGIALVYDYFVKEWSVFTNHNAVAACIYAGNFTYLQPNGVVMTEDDTLFTDAGQYVKLRMVTSWMSFAQLTGFYRAYRLMIQGNYGSPHQLLVQIAYDFNPIFTQQTYINAGSLLQTQTYGTSTPYGEDSVYGGAYPSYAFQVYLEQQRCTSFQLSIEDIAQLPYGEGFSISTIGLLVGTLKGFQRLPDTNKFG